MKAVYGVTSRWSPIKIQKGLVERETLKMYYFKKGTRMDYCSQMRKEDPNIFLTFEAAKKVGMERCKQKIDRKREDLEDLKENLKALKMLKEKEL
jgi:hypothetical protein